MFEQLLEWLNSFLTFLLGLFGVVYPSIAKESDEKPKEQDKQE